SPAWTRRRKIERRCSCASEAKAATARSLSTNRSLVSTKVEISPASARVNDISTIIEELRDGEVTQAGGGAKRGHGDDPPRAGDGLRARISRLCRDRGVRRVGRPGCGAETADHRHLLLPGGGDRSRRRHDARPADRRAGVLDPRK